MLHPVGTLPSKPSKEANARAEARLAAVFAALRKGPSEKGD